MRRSRSPLLPIQPKPWRRLFHLQIAAKENRSGRQPCGPSAQVALCRDFLRVNGGSAGCRLRVGNVASKTLISAKLSWSSFVFAGLLVLARETGASATEVSGPARAVDGDTLDIGSTRVRLFGIDAPE